MESERTMSRSLPPEDIRVGQYVTVMHVLRESEPCDCESDVAWRGVRLQRTLWLPWSGGWPMKVVEVCLPFVLVERANGKHRTLDVRRYKLARVSDRYGDEVFKRVREDQGKRKKKDDDDDDDHDDVERP
ncbi:MAG: hypothetical protein ACYSVY_13930, partial [Planctomycetota bacterium]